MPKELRSSLLRDRPTGIRNLLDLWGKYNVAWKSKDEQMCKKFHAILPRKLLLVGSSGTENLMMSRAIGEECEMSFFMYIASSPSEQYKNSVVQNLEELFEKAASLHKPCAVIIDGLQALFSKHANGKDMDSNVVQFWALLDRYKDSPILVFATLNDLSEAPAQVIDRFLVDTVEIFS